MLKPGGRFAVADIVLTRPLAADLQRHLELWAGCVAGALHVDEYLVKLDQRPGHPPVGRVALDLLRR